MVLYDNIPPVPENLQQVQLGGQTLPGFTVGFRGWTGNRNIDPTWLRNGYAGVHVRGRGPDRTVIRSMSSEASLIMGRGVGYVKLEGMTIKNGFGSGKQKAIHAGLGSSNAPDLINYTLHLKDCVIEVDETNDNDARPEWLMFVDQGNVVLENVLFKSRNSNEHAFYLHGMGPNGCYIINSEIDGVGAEGAKFTARPQARYYQSPLLLAYAEHAYTGGFHPMAEDTWIVLRNTKIRDWHQPHSWRGGAGLTIQGVGANVNVLVDDCQFVDFNETKPAIAIDDGGVEHFGLGNIGGGSPANGHIILRNSIFASGPGPSWYNNVIRMGTIGSPVPIEIARSFVLRNCGVFGDHMLVSLSSMSPERIMIDACNTERIKRLATELNVQPIEAMMSLPGFFGPVSQGWNN